MTLIEFLLNCVIGLALSWLIITVSFLVWIIVMIVLDQAKAQKVVVGNRKAYDNRESRWLIEEKADLDRLYEAESSDDTQDINAEFGEIVHINRLGRINHPSQKGRLFDERA